MASRRFGTLRSNYQFIKMFSADRNSKLMFKQHYLNFVIALPLFLNAGSLAVELLQQVVDGLMGNDGLLQIVFEQRTGRDVQSQIPDYVYSLEFLATFLRLLHVPAINCLVKEHLQFPLKALFDYIRFFGQLDFLTQLIQHPKLLYASFDE